MIFNNFDIENAPKWWLAVLSIISVVVGFFYKVFRVFTMVSEHDDSIKKHGKDLGKLRVAFPHIMAEDDNLPTILTHPEHEALCTNATKVLCKKIDDLKKEHKIEISKLHTSLADRMNRMDKLREDSKTEQQTRDKDLYKLLGRVEEHLNSK